ncbi:hypothetical protein [Paenibacillus sp. GYB003]|uniref:hypothetical protein n=1 Tax=Paenibacillus sp. GYB003 TaxID=2994392 RepID=UPI002F967AE0
MRMGAFLLGGLVGAACVMYLNRNNSWSFAGLSSGAREFAGKRSGAFADSAQKVGSAWNESGLDEVEKMIQKDPAVKHEVDEILSESGNKYMTQ